MIIGLYDSGLGGLTVWQKLRPLTEARLIYFADTAHLPYGEKTPAQLEHYFWNILEFFQARGVRGVVVACNTSSSLVLPKVKEKAPLPVFGVIEAALRAILPVSRGRIGLLATQGTAASGVYEEALSRLRPSWRIFVQSAPRLVPLIERGLIAGPRVEGALREYLAPLLAQKIDTLLLGCTHYPFLKPALERIGGPDLQIVDPAGSLAAEVGGWLQDQLPPGAGGVSEFWVSARPERFRELAQILLQRKLPPVGLYQFPKKGE